MYTYTFHSKSHHSVHWVRLVRFRVNEARAKIESENNSVWSPLSTLSEYLVLEVTAYVRYM